MPKTKGAPEASAKLVELPVRIPAEGVTLQGDLSIPVGATALVAFAHGSGSSRLSPRNQYVAGVLREAGLGTLLFDLLTAKEESEDEVTGALRFNIDLLAQRLVSATDWLRQEPHTRSLRIGYFGASTGAAAALIAAAERPDNAAAVVSRGGCPDLAMQALPRVKAPTLLIVGGLDYEVIELNRQAYAMLASEKQMTIIPGATHLFEEPGTLAEVARLATKWFVSHLRSVSSAE